MLPTNRRYTNYRRYARRPGAARRAARPADPLVEYVEPATKRVSLLYPEAQYATAMSGTRSSLVKLSATIVQGFTTETDPIRYNCLRFGLSEINGFTQYSQTYSEYRIIRAEMIIPTAQTGAQAWLVASSQPVAETLPPIALTQLGTASSWLPTQTEGDLRQMRYQRTIYPQSTTTGVRVGFKPYTLTAAYGPVSATNLFQRIWRGYLWTPFTWALGNPLQYFGPYVAPANTQTDEQVDAVLPVTVTLYCQFKGQK